MNELQHAISVPAILFVSTLTRSTFGFGDALVAMPILAVVVGIEIAAPLVAMTSITIAAAILLLDWQQVHWRSAGWLVGFSYLGIPLGFAFLKGFHEGVLTACLAVVIIGFAGFTLTKPQLPILRTDKSACLFGLLAGVLSGAYNAPGPLLVVYGTMRQWTAPRFRATMQGFFLPTGALVLVLHGLHGFWNPTLLGTAVWYFVISLPVLLSAVFLGRYLNRRINPQVFVRAVYGLLLISGLLLLLTSIRR